MFVYLVNIVNISRKIENCVIYKISFIQLEAFKVDQKAVKVELACKAKLKEAEDNINNMKFEMVEWQKKTIQHINPYIKKV